MRSYTPIPVAHYKKILPPELSAQESGGLLCLMVKMYPNGLLSPVIHRLQPGDSIDVSDPIGSFNFHVMKDFKHLYLLAAGTGVTPMMQIISHALDNQKMQW